MFSGTRGLVFGLRTAVGFAGFQRSGQLLRVEVGAADGAHLAGLQQLLIGAQRFRIGCVRVQPMRQVDVDSIGSQAAERVLDRCGDMGG